MQAPNLGADTPTLSTAQEGPVRKCRIKGCILSISVHRHRCSTHCPLPPPPPPKKRGRLTALIFRFGKASVIRPAEPNQRVGSVTRLVENQLIQPEFLLELLMARIFPGRGPQVLSADGDRVSQRLTNPNLGKAQEDRGAV